MPEEVPPAPPAPETAPAAPEKAAPPEEKALMVSKRSRKAYLFPYFIAVLLIILPFLFFSDINSILGPFFLAVPVLGFLILILLEIIHYFSDELHVTERTVTEKKGILSKHLLTVDYADISAITVKQGALARLLGYGKIIIGVMAAKEPIKFSKIGHPEKVKEIIEEQIRKSQAQPSPRPAPAYPPAPAPPTETG